MLSEVSLHRPPEKLNEIEFAVIFWEHDAEVASSLNCFVHQGLLFLKVRLQINDALGTAIRCIGIAIWFFTLHLEFGSEKTSFGEYLLHSLGLVWKCWVICGKDHVLHDFLP